MDYDITRDDARDRWTVRADVALLLEFEHIEPVSVFVDPDDPFPPVLGEVQAGYRVVGRDVAAAYTGGEENWATLGISKQLDTQIRAHRRRTIERRGHDARGIARRHPAHHCGVKLPCPLATKES